MVALTARPALAAMVAATVLFSAPAGAHDWNSVTITRYVGGEGGSTFSIDCGDDEEVVGVAGGTGSKVDRIAALCARPSDRSTTRLTATKGGQGGDWMRVFCPSSMSVVGLKIWTATQQVRNMVLLCGDAARPVEGPCFGGRECADFEDINGERKYRTVSTTILCPQNHVAAGFRGRSGTLLDAIALACVKQASMAGGSSAGQPAASPQSPAPPPFTRVGSVPAMPGRGPMAAAVGTAASPPPAPTDQCPSGLVWREATPTDHRCVSPEARDRVRQENALADSRRDPNSAYGPQGCMQGYVWREAVANDLVCVPPDSRALAAEENRPAAIR